jgi:DNA-binding beta-propeller fold protein YncE
MTTPDIEIQTPPSTSEETEERKRRTLLLVLLLLLLALCAAGCLFLRYILKPAPITDIIPVVPVQGIPPAYVKMITGVDGPVGVAVSPDSQRIYVAEGAGERLVKAFDRDGNFLFSFAPPGTNKSNRNPTYLAVDQSGRIFLSERYNHVIDIFDANGNFIDAIIDRDMTLTKFISENTSGILPPGSIFYFDNISKQVIYQLPGGVLKAITGPERNFWSPMGLRFGENGDLLITNNPAGQHEVLIFPAGSFSGDLSNFNPQFKEFGKEGKENGQFSFPNNVVRDSKGNYYVSDGNNGRISTWSPEKIYQSFFGFGSTISSLNLPRGMWMDEKDRLHVADAVGQAIRVYDVSGVEPALLFNFGEFGVNEGYFNYPTDICIDSTGRVYIADRENNRIDIWSY